MSARQPLDAHPQSWARRGRRRTKLFRAVLLAFLAHPGLPLTSSLETFPKELHILAEVKSVMSEDIVLRNDAVVAADVEVTVRYRSTQRRLPQPFDELSGPGSDYEHKADGVQDKRRNKRLGAAPRGMPPQIFRIPTEVLLSRSSPRSGSSGSSSSSKSNSTSSSVFTFFSDVSKRLRGFQGGARGGAGDLVAPSLSLSSPTSAVMGAAASAGSAAEAAISAASAAVPPTCEPVSRLLARRLTAAAAEALAAEEAARRPDQPSPVPTSSTTPPPSSPAPGLLTDDVLRRKLIHDPVVGLNTWTYLKNVEIDIFDIGCKGSDNEDLPTLVLETMKQKYNDYFEFLELDQVFEVPESLGSPEEAWAQQEALNNVRSGWKRLAKTNPHPSRVAVALLDRGLDKREVACQWANPGEIAGNQLDDDGNGQVDDVYGASFLPSASPNGPGRAATDGTAKHIMAMLQGPFGSNASVCLADLRVISESTVTVSHLIEALDYTMRVGIPVAAMRGLAIASPAFDAAVKTSTEAGHLFIPEPSIAGVAVMILSYFPYMTTTEVRTLLWQSLTKSGGPLDLESILSTALESRWLSFNVGHSLDTWTRNLSLNLAPSESRTVNIVVDANELFAGSYQAEVVLAAAGQPEIILPLTYQVQGLALLAVSTSAIHFDVAVNSTASYPVILQNRGHGILFLSTVGCDAPCSLALQEDQVPVHGSSTLTFGCSPTTLGNFTQNVRVHTNAGVSFPDSTTQRGLDLGASLDFIVTCTATASEDS